MKYQKITEYIEKDDLSIIPTSINIEDYIYDRLDNGFLDENYLIPPLHDCTEIISKNICNWIMSEKKLAKLKDKFILIIKLNNVSIETKDLVQIINGIAVASDINISINGKEETVSLYDAIGILTDKVYERVKEKKTMTSEQFLDFNFPELKAYRTILENEIIRLKGNNNPDSKKRIDKINNKIREINSAISCCLYDQIETLNEAEDYFKSTPEGHKIIGNYSDFDFYDFDEEEYKYTQCEKIYQMILSNLKKQMPNIIPSKDEFKFDEEEVKQIKRTWGWEHATWVAQEYIAEKLGFSMDEPFDFDAIETNKHI